ncbi:hypothetical protein H920_01145 [Fukomys damarensis]|uniref:Uncharacterized protein n=1 Tax=Fukomys damarensis TaxID=885580 RepID=A0A091EP39_FUKDA|nr:hypothetical protein H920_01145 [Fukomys damarensis]
MTASSHQAPPPTSPRALSYAAITLQSPAYECMRQVKCKRRKRNARYPPHKKNKEGNLALQHISRKEQSAQGRRDVHRRRVVWVDDNADFDSGHVSPSSCDSEMEQEPTDTDAGNADLHDSDGEKRSNVST